LSFGYGKALTGVEGVWSTSKSVPYIDSPPSDGSCCDSAMSHDNGASACESQSVSPFSSYPINLKLTVERHLSTLQKILGTFEYNHYGRQLSLGTIVTRIFDSSSFSRLGFGLRHTWGNIFQNSLWWKKGSTSWLIQLERGDVCFIVPVTISRAVKPCDSLLRLFYASLISVLANIVVGEVLCGVTSKLRLKLFKLFLAEAKVNNVTEDDHMTHEQENENFRRNLSLYAGRDDVARHVKLMTRQAKAARATEESQGGLVIVKAVYGVVDKCSCQWLRFAKRAGKSDFVADEMPLHLMDATVQLQFWVTDSSLHLPAISKKFMLGFYDVLACVGKEEWVTHQAQFNNEDKEVRSKGSYTYFLSLLQFWKSWTSQTKQKRDLAAVLSVRYKFGDTMYDVVFQDAEAADLPSRFARVVSNVSRHG